jgi:DNA-3-methyladenine glycosylase II
MIKSAAPRLFTSQPPTMAARRSARLGALSSELAGSKGPVSGVNGGIKTAEGRKRKIIEVPQKDEDGFAVPSTPKRKKAAVKDAPPSTPTPAAASIMAQPVTSGDSDGKAALPRKNRLANPYLTNAPLISPQTSRVVAQKDVELASPSKLAALPAGTTTGDILEKALAHILALEPKLKPVVEKHKCKHFSPDGLAEEIDPFESLSSGIISQQVGQVGVLHLSYMIVTPLFSILPVFT